MEIDDILPPLPLEPPDELGQDNGQAPPPPPLQTSSDAEEMDVSSGGDGQAPTPAVDREMQPPPPQLLTKGSITFCSHLLDKAQPSPRCPRTARHAPPVTKFLPDLKLLRDVKIRVSFTESSRSKERKVLYTGVGQESGGEAGLDSLNGELHGSVEHGAVEGSSGVGNGAGGRGEEAEGDQENKVEFAVLDELDDFSENFLDHEDGAHGGFRSEVITQQEQADEEVLTYSYEVGLVFVLAEYLTPSTDYVIAFNLCTFLLI